MSKYLIRLTPMGSYFFGGERSFPMGKEDKNEFASYIVESNLFPQQTTLLGMLRFWLLRNNSQHFNLVENRIIDDNHIEDLIGAKGFCINSEVKSFGKIQNISYCFLQKEEDDGSIVNLLPTSLDYNLTLDFTNLTVALYNNKEKEIPYITYSDKESKQYNDKDGVYNDKDGLKEGYINTRGEYLERDCIFCKDQRIGINRDITTGKTIDGDLYKQIFYSLKKGFCFAFIADFADKFILPDSGQIVELGGESSKFILEYKNIDGEGENSSDEEPCYTIITTTEGISKITLLSDAKIENSDVEDNALFSISKHIPFQFLTFETNSNTEYIRKIKDNKSSRFSLFRRGSVFYFNDEKKLALFKNKLENEVMRKIGYNKFQ